MHYAKLNESNKLQAGGPFTNTDSGSIMIATDDLTQDDLEQFAASEPVVVSGLLRFEERTWYIAIENP
jgi:uncharacterized protein YciI